MTPANRVKEVPNGADLAAAENPVPGRAVSATIPQAAVTVTKGHVPDFESRLATAPIAEKRKAENFRAEAKRLFRGVKASDLTRAVKIAGPVAPAANPTETGRNARSPGETVIVFPKEVVKHRTLVAKTAARAGAFENRMATGPNAMIGDERILASRCAADLLHAHRGRRDHLLKTEKKNSITVRLRRRVLRKVMA